MFSHLRLKISSAITLCGVIAGCSNPRLLTANDRILVLTCENGDVVTVLRDPRDAYARFAEGYDKQLTETVEMLRNLRLDDNEQHASIAKQLADNLHDEGAMLNEQLTTIYLTIQLSPCDHE